jgi:hypothetical protein
MAGDLTDIIAFTLAKPLNIAAALAIFALNCDVGSPTTICES